ncbi:MAG: hypothetical protein H9533_11695 [Rhodobacteraceae bacterium]|nr:hypothetical protein [Paracoccaceae bacterium]
MDLSDKPYWFKVVDFLQQNWAVISTEAGMAKVIFFSDTCGIFDELTFPSSTEAESALRRNGFNTYDDDVEAQKLIRRPVGTFRPVPHPNGPIYSSGRFWR